jgi:two-component system nitrogen regulation sensor histidine kinase NtrY
MSRWQEYRKDPRIIITIPLVLVLVTSLVYYLVQRAKELSPEALSSRLLLFVLWNINLVLILGILFVLFRGIIKLIIERQRGILGSRFRTKLVVTYVATSLVPIVILFIVATDLLRVSVERWFNTPIETLLRNSQEIAETAQNRALAEAEGAAREVANSVAEDGDIERVLHHVRQFHAVDFVAIYSDGALIRLLANPRVPVHELSDFPPSFFTEISSRGESTKLDVTGSGKWLRTGVASKNGRYTAAAGVFLPNEISRKIDQSIIAHRDFQQLDSQKETFKASQTSLFLAVTLYILFGTLWISIFASRRITVPIAALAEGTRTLAEGKYDHRIGVKATDEFGSLIDSFNTMASQLEGQRDALTRSNVDLQAVNRQLDEERAYLSTVLESVSTGIVAMNARRQLLSINRAALRILHIEQPGELAETAEVFDGELTPLGDYLRGVSDTDHRPREVTIIRGGELRYLELSAAPLDVAGEERGWVVGIEDSTQLVQAQKLAAWSEAARRIAHEIKNPLTPIQLSAERIAKKYRNGDPDLGRVLEEGCRTIVSEVSQLKEMVDEFSRFARMPAIHLRQTPIREVLDEAAALYREVKPDVAIEVDADPSLRVLIDPEQMRRAMINLLDNAVDATERGVIRVSARRRNRALVIEVADPGRGVPDTDKEKLFLPYFSTKGRGTGLGLAIVHRIVHDHDGRISVHDNSPKGTRFEIELPA